MTRIKHANAHLATGRSSCSRVRCLGVCPPPGHLPSSKTTIADIRGSFQEVTTGVLWLGLGPGADVRRGHLSYIRMLSCPNVVCVHCVGGESGRRAMKWNADVCLTCEHSPTRYFSYFTDSHATRLTTGYRAARSPSVSSPFPELPPPFLPSPQPFPSSSPLILSPALSALLRILCSHTDGLFDAWTIYRFRLFISRVLQSL